MNAPLPDIMRCPSCAAEFAVTQILAQPSEFVLVRGEIECPICKEAKLDPCDDVSMPEAFREFIEGLPL